MCCVFALSYVMADYVLSYLCKFYLLLTVQGNAGGEIDRGLKKDLVSLRTFHMEYDICYVSWFTY